MNDTELAVCPDDGKLCLLDCEEHCADLILIPDDDELVAMMGTVLLAGTALIVFVFAALILIALSLAA